MHDGETRTSVTLATIELLSDGGGTRLVLTDQSAFLGGEDPAARERGYGTVLTNLAAYLELRHRAP